MFIYVGLGSSDAGRHYGEPPRRIESRDLAARQAFPAQQSNDAIAEFLRCSIDHSRRDLFAADF
jgi:hypothetical protein